MREHALKDSSCASPPSWLSHVQDGHYSSAWILISQWCNRFHLKISEHFPAPKKSLIGTLYCISQFYRGLNVVLRSLPNLLVTELGSKTGIAILSCLLQQLHTILPSWCQTHPCDNMQPSTTLLFVGAAASHTASKALVHMSS